MSNRKGELSKNAIDRGWPHQVALPEEDCIGSNYMTIHSFCADLSLCKRGHFFRRNDQGFNVFCFADKSHAERFQMRFGGELIDPKNRPRWPGSR